MNPLSIFLVIITALSWSLSNILGKMLMREMNPTLYSALRLLFAATAFTPVILVNGPILGGPCLSGSFRLTEHTPRFSLQHFNDPGKTGPEINFWNGAGVLRGCPRCRLRLFRK
ncbi:MAG: EamA family transporter [Hadesarchaea archaeon]|nr:EamA family transporter [Hadesarchaea archaeon]